MLLFSLSQVHADVSGGVENPDRIVASYQCPVCDYNTKKKDHFARHMKQVRYGVGVLLSLTFVR